MFVSERFDARRHDISEFSCGEPELDDWLKAHAANVSAKRLAQVHVWSGDARPGTVAAFYTLSAHQITREGRPRRFRGGPAAIPAVLLGKLGLDRSLHGQGLGAVLLSDALERVVEASDTVGGRYVVVDALHDQAASFYEKHGLSKTGRCASSVSRARSRLRK